MQILSPLSLNAVLIKPLNNKNGSKKLTDLQTAQISLNNTHSCKIAMNIESLFTFLILADYVIYHGSYKHQNGTKLDNVPISG